MKGFAELEYGMLRYMGAIDNSTPVVTTGMCVFFVLPSYSCFVVLLENRKWLATCIFLSEVSWCAHSSLHHIFNECVCLYYPEVGIMEFLRESDLIICAMKFWNGFYKKMWYMS